MQGDLTPSERTVARLLAEGKSMGEIAAALGVGQRAAYLAVSSARAKLGARTMPHLAAIAVRLGL